jgi:hypothetical protein
LNLLEGEEAHAILNVEVKMFFDFVLDSPQNCTSYLSRIVWEVRLELQSVLVDALDGRVVKLQSEVVAEELHLLT